MHTQPLISGGLFDSPETVCNYIILGAAPCTNAATAGATPSWQPDAWAATPLLPASSVAFDDALTADPLQWAVTFPAGWAGGTNYSGIVCAAGDCSQLYWTCAGGGTGPTVAAAVPSGTVCYKGAIVPLASAPCITNKW